MATIALSTDGYFVAGTTEIANGKTLILPTGTNTYTLPGAQTNQTPGGVPLGFTFVAVQVPSQTSTFAAPSGYTLTGISTITAANSAQRFIYVGGLNWVGA